ncbi:bifunctional glutamate N-acetyltransferase/amino-acid acetyltransferase ArgJ [Bartonella sp. HY761]|uniref:bifunctional glutamate N-acetyltransferase/amino-acid acetyltransferase ArgJ n=1 Tax=Bartonella sp. HY761 TaxID=2979330 RepID=UPI002203AC71|nr:bifunctional glutamate N-acetyltransferase/amino-acid acetyltransferase ArgJ [Bartonella sp. HY761]UXN07869.1 bifunctional glutamate N-acetyltransferase/amino-acid acetyltransferase ArgJ [Bartonella sp. HY761]
MMTAISPLAPQSYPDMPSLKGVRMATAQAGIKYKNRTDLLFLVFDQPADVAGVFTRSRCPSATVDHCRASLAHGKAKAVVVNSGNANAFTGKKGKVTTTKTAEAAAAILSCREDEIYLASTGVIGEPLDASRITNVLDGMVETMREDSWLDAARAIMTTDTFPKVATRSFEIDGIKLTINGMAKGAGMIAPDMATMLSFVVTDAPIESILLQKALSTGTEISFNSITVDSDTSTSDTLLLFATGTALEQGVKPITDEADPRFAVFKAALNDVLQDLAVQVASDGEGARKLIKINVRGATDNKAAKKIAMSIANSPLVKTAVAGEDANWGRVVMAVGKAGEEADRDRLAIWFGDIRVAVDGERDPDYSEEATSNYMKNSEVLIGVDIGLGNGEATVWTCDLTKEYVAINGDYRS